ncbi:hypothetical protein Tco_0971380 [Tanacetum coccineum]
MLSSSNSNLSSSNFQTASKSLLIPTESSTVCLTMNGQSGVTSQGGAIADVVKYDEESLMPACPTTVQQQKQPPYPIPPEQGMGEVGACATTVADIDNQSKPDLLLMGLLLIIVYMYLMKLLKLKYQGEKERPFEEYLLMCTYFVVLITVGFVLAKLCYDFGRSQYKKAFPRHV